MNSTKRSSSSRSSRRGVAATELAVCLPVIVLLVLATIEACSMVFLKQSLTVAAYEATHAALDGEATAADVRAAAEQVLKDRRVQGAQVSVTPANLDLVKPGDFLTVSISAPCSSNAVLRNMFYRGKSLTANASMMLESAATSAADPTDPSTPPTFPQFPRPRFPRR